MAFNLAEAAGYQKFVSNLDTTAEISQIPLDQIEANEKNFFDTSDIADLAESIQVNGVLQPLLVVEDGARFRLLAGHRRLLALQELHRSTKNPRWKSAPCRVLPPMSEPMEQLILLQTNTTARQLSYTEKMEAAVRLKKILLKLKSEGVKLPGRLRDIQAQQLEISRTELARMHVIESQLSQPLMQRLQNHQITPAAAYELARLDDAGQEHFEAVLQGGRAVCAADVQIYGEKAVLPWIEKDCPLPTGYTDSEARSRGEAVECRHWREIKAHKDKGHPERCPACCYRCTDRAKCKDVCPAVREQIQAELRRKEREAEQEARNAREERSKELLAKMGLKDFSAKLQKTIDDSQFSLHELAQKINCCLDAWEQMDGNWALDEMDLQDLLQIETVEDFTDSCLGETIVLLALADILDVEISWLMGQV